MQAKFRETAGGAGETRTARDVRITGVNDVRTLPSSASPACPVAQQVMRMQQGCPPGRHVRVRGPDAAAPSSSSSGGDFTAYSQSTCTSTFKQSMDPSDDDRSLFGSPIRVYHLVAGFRPTLELWDGDSYVEDVSGDFVVWEITGGISLSYNSSASDAGCVSQPVSWSEFLRSGGVDRESWTPQVHRNCWIPDPAHPLVEPDSEYVVMNSSGVAALHFPLSIKDGTYYFRARVVDTAYSYCDLTARFAVELYGAPLDAVTIVIVVLTVTAAVVLLLIGTYYHYKQQLLRKEKKQK